jgi:dolichol-phosphate mannosyltransferase
VIADGQHPVRLLPEMLKRWRNGEALIIAAKKVERTHDSLLQKLRSRLFNAVMKRLTDLDMEDSSDYRLLDRKVVDALLRCPEKVRFFRGMTVWSGYPVMEIPFDVPARLSGTGKWGTLGLIKLSLNAMVAYTSRPLYYVFFIGASGVLLSFFLGLQALYSWAAGIAIDGWTSLTLVILFFGSLNLVATGIIGLYLSHLFSEIKRRPSYFIAEEIDGVIHALSS